VEVARLKEQKAEKYTMSLAGIQRCELVKGYNVLETKVFVRE